MIILGVVIMGLDISSWGIILNFFFRLYGHNTIYSMGMGLIIIMERGRMSLAGFRLIIIHKLIDT